LCLKGVPWKYSCRISPALMLAAGPEAIIDHATIGSDN
jgi:hypothetical protein